jgi:hypothetical protein
MAMWGKQKEPMDLSEMKRRACKAIDRLRDEIIALGRTIRDNPELGFKEH